MGTRGTTATQQKPPKPPKPADLSLFGMNPRQKLQKRVTSLLIQGTKTLGTHNVRVDRGMDTLTELVKVIFHEEDDPRLSVTSCLLPGHCDTFFFGYQAKDEASNNLLLFSRTEFLLESNQSFIECEIFYLYLFQSSSFILTFLPTQCLRRKYLLF